MYPRRTSAPVWRTRQEILPVDPVAQHLPAVMGDAVDQPLPEALDEAAGGVVFRVDEAESDARGGLEEENQRRQALTPRGETGRVEPSLEGEPMSHTLTLNVPESLYRSLVRKADAAGQALEVLAVQLLATATRPVAGDPLEEFIGAFNSRGIDWADQHDAHIGSALKETMKG